MARASSARILAELLVAPVRDGRMDTDLAVLAALEVHELPFSEDAAIRPARLRAETGLKMPDCYVLLAVEALDASVATFDGRVMQLAQKRGIPVVRPA